MDAGDHAYGLEGAGVTGEVTVRKQGIRQGEVGYLLSPDVAHKTK